MVLSDVRMSGMDGLELVRQIRQNLPVPDIKIIIMTGKMDYALDDFEAAGGIQGFFTKPADIVKVLEIVKKVLQGKKCFHDASQYQ